MNCEREVPSTLYVMVDENCNLNCSYCFEKHKNNYRMDESLIKDLVTFIVTNNIKRVFYWGGEPTLNSNFIIKMSYLLPKDIMQLISTNCVNYNEDLVKAIKDNNIMMQLSIDGRYSAMKQRTSNNKKLYRKIIKNVKKYVKAGVRTTASMTIDRSDVYNAYSNFKFLYRLGIQCVSANLNMDGKYSEKEIETYLIQTKKIEDYYKTHRKPIGIFYTNIGYGVNYVCGAERGVIAVNYKGNLYSCYRLYTSYGDRFKIGNIYDGIVCNNDDLLIHTDYGDCKDCKKTNTCVRCLGVILDNNNSLNKNYCNMVGVLNDGLQR